MKKVIQRVQKLNNGVPPLPATLKELIIPQQYTVTLKNEQFLLFDSGIQDKERILLFSTNRNLELLSETNSEWFMDGTCKTAPNLFAQILTIHVLRFNTVIPIYMQFFRIKGNLLTKGYSVKLKNCNRILNRLQL